jgi:ketosteroid isomerase-like protein
MAADRNVEFARVALDAFNRGDTETVLGFLDPEIECRVGEGLINSGTWRGITGYQEMIANWTDAWDQHDLVVRALEPVGPTNLIALVHQRAIGRESGVPVEMDVAFLFEIAGGRARRFEIHPDRASAEAAI